MSDLDNDLPSRNDLIAAARKLWGQETHTTRHEMRFGAKGSKSIKLDDLVWFDHEAGLGGGAIELCQRAGLEPARGNGSFGLKLAAAAARRNAEPRTPSSPADWTPMVPPPDNAVPPSRFQLACDTLHRYCGPGGEILFYVRRYETPRFFLPLTYGTLVKATGWHQKAPQAPIPLYGLDLLREIEPELVLLCEGEKAADAANRKIAEEQLPWAALAWFGGAARAGHADLAPLAGYRVAIWPDADEAGQKAGARLKEMRGQDPMGLCAEVLDTTGLAEGFDAADLDGRERIEAFVASRLRPFGPSGKPQEPSEPALAQARLKKPGEPDEPAPEPPKPPPADRATNWPWIDIAPWSLTDPPPPQWTVRDLIPHNQVTLFSGEGAAGKSTIALHLAAATALGQTWLNYFPEQGPAFFIDTEDDPNIIWWRLAAVAKFYSTSIAEMKKNGLHIRSLCGEDCVMGEADQNRGRITPTQLYKDLLAEAKAIRPKIIVIASCANVYSGKESERHQVQAFVNLLKAVAMAASGSVILISHPSLTGIASGTGMSGSTQWHNAVRARIVITANAETGLRQLEFQKNQYGPKSEKLGLEWRQIDRGAGMYLPKAGETNIEKATRENRAEAIFAKLLVRRLDEGRHVSDRPRAGNYAPKVFCIEQEAKEARLKKDDLEDAMTRLFAKGLIRMKPYGPPSDKTESISPVEVE